MTKHEIKLIPKERKRLLSIVTKGVNKAAVIRRAHILLESDEGKTDREISERLYVNEDTVRNNRAQLCGYKLPCTTNRIRRAKRCWMPNRKRTWSPWRVVTRLPDAARVARRAGRFAAGLSRNPARRHARVSRSCVAGPGVTLATAPDELRAMVQDCEADLVVVGYTHWPQDHQVDRVRPDQHGQHQQPLGTRRARQLRPAGCRRVRYRITFRRVAYDIDAVIEAVRQVHHPMADAIISDLRGERRADWL
jgi:hypothetical protein